MVDNWNRVINSDQRNRRITPITKEGWISNTKDPKTMRIFYLNPHSFRYDNKEKFYQL